MRKGNLAIWSLILSIALTHYKTPEVWEYNILILIAKTQEALNTIHSTVWIEIKIHLYLRCVWNTYTQQKYVK